MEGPTIGTVLRKLRLAYDPPRSFLNWETPLDLLIATILSARCTDAKVNEITSGLFSRYRLPSDYLAVPVSRLEKEIHSCGNYRSKAKYIQGTCRAILEKFSGEVPRTMEELTSLPGVGRKTASIVLYAAFDKSEGIAVDTHVRRVSLRLGLSGSHDPSKIEKDLMEKTPRKDWGAVNALMISHGRKICRSRNRRCQACMFKNECPSSLILGKEDLSKD